MCTGVKSRRSQQVQHAFDEYSCSLVVMCPHELQQEVNLQPPHTKSSHRHASERPTYADRKAPD
eukprot:1860286-Amphidinium_carterae.1